MSQILTNFEGQRARDLASRPLAGHRGFTLVEMVVVIVILGVVAGLIGPRLVRRGSRQAERTVQRVGAMFDMASRRVSMSSDPVLIEFDHEDEEIRVLSREREEGFSQSWDRRDRWRVDPLISAIPLGEIEITGVLVDAKRIREKSWQIELGGVGSPARIQIDLSTSKPERTWRIVVDRGAGRSVVGSPDELAEMAAVVVDLDDAGKQVVPW